MESAKTNTAGLAIIEHIRAPKHGVEEAEYLVANLVEVDINNNQFSALVCFAISMGAGCLARSALLARLNDSDHFGAAREFNRWVIRNKKRSNHLVKLREAEKRLFLLPAIVVNNAG